MIDRQGKPLLDPTKSDEGFLLPIGGYKGYGLSLIVGILAGTLNGAAMGSQVIDFNKDFSTTTNTGQAIAVIDPAAFGDILEFKQNVDRLIGELRNAERMPSVERIWLPGEQSHHKRLAHEKQGVLLAPSLVKQLHELAAQLGVSPLSPLNPLSPL